MRRLAFLAACGYLCLLLLSYAFTEWRHRGKEAAGAERDPYPWVEWSELYRSQAAGQILIRFAVEDARPKARTILLIPGFDSNPEQYAVLIEALRANHEVLFPVWGGAIKGAPGSTGETHSELARHLEAWLDAGGWSGLHIMAYGYGAGAGVQLGFKRPELVESLVLVSAVASTPYEVFGNYELNRSLYGLYYASLWLAQTGTPHFGTLREMPVDRRTGERLYRSDSRPLARMMKYLTMPVMILHGESDVFAPLGAAHEYERLIPQSESMTFRADHRLPLAEPDLVAAATGRFIERVAAGEARTLESAPLERRLHSIEPFMREKSPPLQGIALVIVFILIMCATFISEDLTCITAGFLVANGSLSLTVAIASCYAGIFLGDAFLYLSGRFLGRRALKHRPFRWIVSESSERQAEAWFRQRGTAIILITRFIPGTRTGTYFTAGVLRAKALPFFVVFALSALVWTPVVVGLAAFLGSKVLGFYGVYHAFALPLFILLGLIAYLVIHYGMPLMTWKGRRLLWSKYKRARKWEYWPSWQLYGPILPAIVARGILKYGGVSVCTAANPGMPHGGIIGERKSDILRGFGDHPAVPPWTLIATGPSDERWAALGGFMKENHLDYPVVLKPDEGQRGLGVKIVRDGAGARDYLERIGGPVIAQEFLTGPEFGVFYVRRPGEKAGRIFSITIKEPLVVLGDGVSTLERLILADERAVCLAPLFLERFADRIDYVVEEGEPFALVEIGTHAQGCVFRDGAELRTPELERSVDDLAKACDGFYFGRFDLRAPDREAFRAGRGLRMIEVNGITSEATHMYDPSYVVEQAWDTLLEQWSLAYEIGRENVQRGFPASSIWAVLRDWRAASRRQASYR